MGKKQLYCLTWYHNGIYDSDGMFYNRTVDTTNAPKCRDDQQCSTFIYGTYQPNSKTLNHTNTWALQNEKDDYGLNTYLYVNKCTRESTNNINEILNENFKSDTISGEWRQNFGDRIGSVSTGACAGDTEQTFDKIIDTINTITSGIKITESILNFDVNSTMEEIEEIKN